MGRLTAQRLTAEKACAPLCSQFTSASRISSTPPHAEVKRPEPIALAVIEMSLSSWLVAGIVPGVERQPLKKLAVDESGERQRDRGLCSFI
jgi:hypothetical protein